MKKFLFIVATIFCSVLISCGNGNGNATEADTLAIDSIDTLAVDSVDTLVVDSIL